VKGLPDSAEMRKKLYAVESFGEVEGIFGEYLDTHSQELAELAA
jgi:hypothetical protein